MDRKHPSESLAVDAYAFFAHLDPNRADRDYRRYLAGRRTAIDNCEPRRFTMLPKDWHFLCQCAAKLDAMLADSGHRHLLSEYHSREMDALLVVHTGQKIWEFELGPDGLLPADQTPAGRRLAIQPYLEGMARALHACFPVADSIPQPFRGVYLNAVRLIGHWGYDDLREPTFLTMGRKTVWTMEMIVLHCLGRTVASFVPEAPFFPDRQVQPGPTLPADIFNGTAFFDYCATLTQTRKATAAVVDDAEDCGETEIDNHYGGR